MAQKRKSNKRSSNFKKQIGIKPGVVIYTGHKEDKDLVIDYHSYNEQNLEKGSVTTVEDILKLKNESSKLWANLNGLNHTQSIEKLCNELKINALSIADVVHVGQRPKVDENENYIFILLKMLQYDIDGNLNSEQVSFILGHNFLLTFQEAEGDVFNGVRERLQITPSRIRSFNQDYLLYALIDAIVDHYYLVIETLGNKVETLEDQLFNGKSDDHVTTQIQELKREVLRIRRSVFPLREVIGRLEKSEHPLINKQTANYFRDVYEHIIQILENIDINREMIWGLMDMHMTAISNRMNEVMKVLTIIATIFIPLTFIAGIYGMNFENIPELHYQNAYFILLGLMFLIVVGMIFYFKRKKWL